MNASGVKARVGIAKSSYSDWRRTVGQGCYANDLDWVEWRLRAGIVEVVAFIETTFYQDKPAMRHLLPNYCQAILERFKRDGQYQVLMVAAARFQVPAYLVVVREDLAVFWVCRLRDELWRQMDEPQYRRWVIGLGRLHQEVSDGPMHASEIPWGGTP